MTGASTFLVGSASKYAKSEYGATNIKYDEQIIRDLAWRPSLHFKRDKFITTAMEASETPYPMILRLRRADIVTLQFPIEAYSVCAAEAYDSEGGRREAKELQAHGFGLIVVDAKGAAETVITAIPLVQHVPDAECRALCVGLPKKLRLYCEKAFRTYKSNPSMGVTEISQGVEAVVVEAAGGLAKKKLLGVANPAGLALAKVLDEMWRASACQAVRGEIGGARNYVAKYRNVASHIPKNRKEALRKYVDCRNGFCEGVRKIVEWREGMGKIGISVTGKGLP